MPQPLIQIDARAALRSFVPIGPALHEGAVRGHNDVVLGAMRFERGQLPRRLDRPSGFTRKGVQVDRAGVTQATPEATVSRTGTFRVIDCSCGQVDEDGDATGALVLVEYLVGDAPRHVRGRRTWQLGEQLRRAA